MSRFTKLQNSALALWLLGSPAAYSQAKKEVNSAAEWPMFNRDLGSTRYSPLAQVNAKNVSRLTRAWSYKIGTQKNSGSITGGSEVTPIVVQGVMYLTTSTEVVALEPESGKVLWTFPATGPGNLTRRGVSYWPGDQNNPPRIIFTMGRRMIALNAKIGRAHV